VGRAEGVRGVIWTGRVPAAPQLSRSTQLCPAVRPRCALSPSARSFRLGTGGVCLACLRARL
jgi:hypothetical protein